MILPTPSSGHNWLNVLDTWQEVIETVAGYKRRAIAAGFSADVADVMALQFHEYLANVMTEAATDELAKGEAT